MSRQIQIRRGSATEHNNFTGAIGEITMDTTNKTLRVHDGTTVGGNEIMSMNNFYSYITNCVIDIPQDIKLVKRSNGTLVLLAGSKLYVPNGFEQDGTTFKFDCVTITNDVAVSCANGQMGVFYNPDNNTVWANTLHSNQSSETNAPTGSGLWMWYDTTNNIIRVVNNGSVATNEHFSFPLGIVTVVNAKVTNIDQVFNGFGFIGGKIFALPGVRGLAPNGRNTNGTLKNTVVTISKPVLCAAYTTCFFAKSDEISPAYYAVYVEQENFPNVSDCFWYKPSENKIYRVYSNSIESAPNYFYCFDAKKSNNKVEKLTPKLPICIVDANDTKFISNQAMPSNRYINLTLGSSGTTYTAPADGFYTLAKKAGAVGEYLYMINQSNNITSGMLAPNALYGRIFMPVSKGDVITINYTYSGDVAFFKFVYANGAK